MTALLDDPAYKEKARFYGNILKDNIVPPLEEAVFHVEYVLRHKGATFLR